MATVANDTRFRIAFNRMALREKLPKGDPRWGTFNDSFDNLTLSPVEIADQIYKGYAYTTWHSGRRNVENFICGQFIAIDMDSEDDRSRLDVLSEHPFVRMYGGILHTTPSHTEAAPRARVIFLLDRPIETGEGYTEAIRFLIAMFASDAACKDAAHFFYGASGCDLRIPDNVLPVSVLRRYYLRWMARTAKQQWQRLPTMAHENVISLDAERQRRRSATMEAGAPDDVEKLRTALGKIDPWAIDYNRWIGVIAAAKREFGEPAFGVIESWAQGKPGEVRREWERLKVAGRAKSTSAGTIYYLAAGGR